MGIYVMYSVMLAGLVLNECQLYAAHSRVYLHLHIDRLSCYYYVQHRGNGKANIWRKKFLLFRELNAIRWKLNMNLCMYLPLQHYALMSDWLPQAISLNIYKYFNQLVEELTERHWGRAVFAIMHRRLFYGDAAPDLLQLHGIWIWVESLTIKVKLIKDQTSNGHF